MIFYHITAGAVVNLDHVIFIEEDDDGDSVFTFTNMEQWIVEKPLLEVLQSMSSVNNVNKPKPSTGGAP